MGNDCFAGSSTYRCHVCHTSVPAGSICFKCRPPQNPYVPQGFAQKLMIMTPEKGPMLIPPRLLNPSSQGDGLYPPGTAFQNQNQFISQKLPANNDQTVFKWERRKTWFYPPIIRDFNPTIIKYRTFQEKLLWFRLNIEKLRVSWQNGSEELKIDRGTLIKSSVAALANPKINLRKEIKIHFNDQEVMDAGGLQREWMHLLLKQIFNEENDMFELCDSQETAYKFKNDKSNNISQMKEASKLLGTLMGKAIFDRIPIKCFLNRTILRQLCSQPVYINDFCDYDHKIHESYTEILKNNNSSQLGLDFCIYKTNSDDSLQMIELCTNGQSTMLNDGNKSEYIKQCIDYYSTRCCEQFIKELKVGLYRVIPQDLLTVFEPYELEMIINGPPNIDTKDWEENTIYKGYTTNSQVVKWYWQCVHKMDQDQLSNLLHYTTGTTRVPVLGFKYLESNRNQISRFAIHKVEKDSINPYPKSHTCFNRLQLPNYTSFDDLQDKLMTIVNEQINHFGLE